MTTAKFRGAGFVTHSAEEQIAVNGDNVKIPVLKAVPLKEWEVGPSLKTTVEGALHLLFLFVQDGDPTGNSAGQFLGNSLEAAFGGGVVGGMAIGAITPSAGAGAAVSKTGELIR